MLIREFLDALRSTPGQHTLASVLEGPESGERLLRCEGVPVWPARPEGLLARNAEGEEVLIPGATVVCAVGQRSNRDDVMALRSCAPWVREIGDCVRVSNITNAIYMGYHAGLDA